MRRTWGSLLGQRDEVVGVVLGGVSDRLGCGQGGIGEQLGFGIPAIAPAALTASAAKMAAASG